MLYTIVEKNKFAEGNPNCFATEKWYYCELCSIPYVYKTRTGARNRAHYLNKIRQNGTNYEFEARELDETKYISIIGNVC